MLALVGIDVDVRTAGEVVLVEDLLPVPAAVHRLEQATLFVGAPFPPERARVDHVGVARVDDQPRDLLGIGQADVRPVPAGVDRLVDAVPDRRVVARVAFTRAGVDDVGVGRRDGDGADRRRPACRRRSASSVTPPFVDLKMPPTAPAMYSVFGSPGSPTNTGTRPACAVGPMLRHVRRFNASTADAGPAAGACACGRAAPPARERTSTSRTRPVRALRS